MFNFFGRKERLLAHYPSPQHDTIVEPFAGSGAYAVRHRTARRVILIERDATVCALWRRLLSMSTSDLLHLPVPEIGEQCSDFLIAVSAARTTKDTPSLFRVTARMREEFARSIPRMALVLDACRHFEVIEGDYREAPDIEATWFVDPPYQYQSGRWDRTAGGRYLHGSRDLDYGALGSWCLSRKGLLIACEQAGASWLPWQHTRVTANSRQKQYREVWYEQGSVPTAQG